MVKKLPLILLFFYSSLQAQYFDYSLTANLQGLIYTKEESPFWMHSNQRGRIDEKTQFAGWLNAAGTYITSDSSSIQAGLGGLFQNGYSDEAQLDEFYFGFENNWLKIYAGRRHEQEVFSGLSATNQSILWSLNSRPLPGISLTIKPLVLWEEAGLGFKASWEEFLTDDERYIDNVRIHHKSLHLIFSGIPEIEILAGLNHYVQWGGESETLGKLPSGFRNYLRVITGSGFSGAADDFIRDNEINALGNHLGGYEIQLNTSFSDYAISLLYNTIFEDFSGVKLRNTPDGRYGIYIEDQRDLDQWIKALMYEFYYTRHQSKTYPTPDGKDNYFNNHLYRSGWTYDDRVIGLPFILPNENGFGIAHNNIVAHHLGFSGNAFYMYPYKFLASYRGNYGAKAGTFEPIETVLSTYLEIGMVQQYVDLDLLFGMDLSSSEDTNLGFGLRMTKTFF